MIGLIACGMVLNANANRTPLFKLVVQLYRKPKLFAYCLFVVYNERVFLFFYFMYVFSGDDFFSIYIAFSSDVHEYVRKLEGQAAWCHDSDAAISALFGHFDGIRF